MKDFALKYISDIPIYSFMQIHNYSLLIAQALNKMMIEFVEKKKRKNTFLDFYVINVKMYDVCLLFDERRYDEKKIASCDRE
mgnify:FL=1